MHSPVNAVRKFLKIDESELAIRRAIKELHALSDRELNDLGLSRSTIESAVRYGGKKDESFSVQRAA